MQYYCYKSLYITVSNLEMRRNILYFWTGLIDQELMQVWHKINMCLGF